MKLRFSLGEEKRFLAQLSTDERDASTPFFSWDVELFKSKKRLFFSANNIQYGEVTFSVIRYKYISYAAFRSNPCSVIIPYY